MGHLSPLPSLTLHLPPPIPSSPYTHVPAQHNQPLSLTQTQLCPVSSPPRKQCIDHTPFGHAQFPVCICGQAEQLVMVEHPLWGGRGGVPHTFQAEQALLCSFQTLRPSHHSLSCQLLVSQSQRCVPLISGLQPQACPSRQQVAHRCGVAISNRTVQRSPAQYIQYPMQQ